MYTLFEAPSVYILVKSVCAKCQNFLECIFSYWGSFYINRPPTKIPAEFSVQIEKLILEFICKEKDQEWYNFEKELNLHYLVIVWCWLKGKHGTNGTYGTSRNRPTHTCSIQFWQRQFDGERIVFSTNSPGTIGYLYAIKNDILCDKRPFKQNWEHVVYYRLSR